MMPKLSYTAKIMCLTLAGVCVFFTLLGFFIITTVYTFEGLRPYITGLIAGTLVSLAKVVLLERSLNRLADMGEAGLGDEPATRAYGFGQYVLRSALTLVIVFLALLFSDIIGPFGAVIGVLSIQLSALITGFLLRKDSIEV